MAPALFRAFVALRPSTKEGAYYRDVHEALLAVAQPEWAPDLLPMLDSPLPMRGKGRLAPEELSALRDGVYRIITAVHLLGELQREEAVRPLLRVVLDPKHIDAADEAMIALVKIGKPTAAASTALLLGTDREIVAYRRERIREFSPEVAAAVMAAFPALEESALRFVAAQVLDHHLPQGSLAVADQLEVIVKHNARSPDRDKVAGDKPLRDLMHRLRARAEP